MRRKSNSEAATFDRALTDAFREDSACGAFGTFDDFSRRRMINDILSAASDAEPDTVVLTGTPPLGRSKVFIAAAAAIILIIAGVFGGFYYGRDDAPPEIAGGIRQETYFGEVEYNDGDLYFGDKIVPNNAPVPLGRTIRTNDGTAVFRLPTGIAWCMGRRSRGRIAFFDADNLTVSLRSGESWFRVDPKREGPLFSVDTEMGRIDVTGTIFIVNAEPSDVRVTLLEGAVWVTLPSGRRERVTAGHTMRLRVGAQEALSEAETRELKARLARLTWKDAPSTAGADALQASRNRKKTPQRSQTTAASQARGGHENIAPSKLLQEIRFQRKRGDWRQVATLYGQLIQSASGSEAAIVSRVPLGDIYLTKLHKYNEAFTHFEKYLQSGHTALLPEALYGKCSALGAMGKKKREKDCLNGFVRRFSDAFQSSDARARLEALRAVGENE